MKLFKCAFLRLCSQTKIKQLEKDVRNSASFGPFPENMAKSNTTNER